MVKDQFPVRVKAAAELELRRRRKERGRDCHFCGLIELINEVYGNGEGRPAECTHSRELQDPNSDRNRHREETIEAIYGRGAIDRERELLAGLRGRREY